MKISSVPLPSPTDLSTMPENRRPNQNKGSKLTQNGEPSASTNPPLAANQPFGSNLQQQLPVSMHHQVPQQTRQPQQQRAPKVAIPRLRRDSDSVSTAASNYSSDKHRVSHACEPCRHRKTKCSGERPQCRHCQDFRIPCAYADGKRTRIKKEFGNLIGRLEEYEKLLRDLSLRAEEPDQLLIQKVLEQDLAGDDDETASISSSRKNNYAAIYGGAAGDNDEAEGENFVSARVGSTESLDHIHEDFNQSAASRATGFMGKNSELTWIQRLKRQTAYGSDQSDDEILESTFTDGNKPALGNDSDGLTPINESTYHCDDVAVLIPDETDQYEFPSKRTATYLFQLYMDSVHPAFPILGKTTFTDQFHKKVERENLMPGDNWLAIVNLIFAIGAKYSHLVQAEWRGDTRDHLIYFTRARKLGFNGESILAHAELQSVQITGLMAFYFTAVNQINRAWSMSGIAIRYACTLGLNLQSENRQMSDDFKEIRYRVWWALCSVERLLAVMTGRSTCFVETDCTVPLPIPIDEELFFTPINSKMDSSAVQLFRRYSSQDSLHKDGASSTTSSGYSAKLVNSPADSFSPVSPPLSDDKSRNSSPSHALYFLYHSKLSIFTTEVLKNLYRANVISRSWSQIQTVISKLELKLENWRQSLPPVFDFAKKQRDQQFIRQRMSLGFSYYSTLMIITRPCLCRIDRKIPNESGKAKDFNRSTAAKCVHAAKDMLGMMPNEPNSIGLYMVTPWWCIVHHLVQATSILMLELSFRADHLPKEVDEILNSAKKAVCWLRSMSESDLAAYRAWKLCDDMLRKVAPKVGRRADDLHPNTPIPSHHMTGSLPSPFKISDDQDSNPDGGPSNYFSSNMNYQGQEFQNTLSQPQLYSSYDDFSSIPVNNSDLPQFNPMFPVTSHMDEFGSASLDGSGSHFGPHQDWSMDQGNS